MSKIDEVCEVYTLKATAIDLAGNVTTMQATVNRSARPRKVRLRRLELRTSPGSSGTEKQREDSYTLRSWLG